MGGVRESGFKRGQKRGVGAMETWKLLTILLVLCVISGHVSLEIIESNGK